MGHEPRANGGTSVVLEIETERLLIRNFCPDDAEALREMIVQKASSAYAAYDHEWPTDREAIRGIVEWFAGGDRFLAVCLKEAGTFIGFIALNPAEGIEETALDLGYCFAARYHGKGYATEGCAAAIDHAFCHLATKRITSATAAENGPSCRLLARMGLRVVGESEASFRTRPDGTPITFTGLAHRLTREEWLLLRGTPPSPGESAPR